MQLLLGSLVVYWILLLFFTEWTAEKIWMGFFAGLLFCMWVFLAAVILIEFFDVRFLEDCVLLALLGAMVAGQMSVFSYFGKRGV